MLAYTFSLLVCTAGLSDSEESFTIILDSNNGLCVKKKERRQVVKDKCKTVTDKSEKKFCGFHSVEAREP